MTVDSPRSGPNGAVLIIAATVVAGIAGYLVTWLVYRSAGSVAYALFAVFWAALYLVVGGLSGIQQEITRATHPIGPGIRTHPSKARNFAVVAAAAVFVAIVATAPLWVGAVFPDVGWPLVWPLAVGAASYVLVATLSGSLYGVSHWRSLALMIGADGLLRILLLGIVLIATHDIVVLAWVVALPFPLAIMLLWPLIRGTFVGRSDLDVGYRALSWNVSRTVLAAVSTAVLVSGFPLLVGVTSHSENPALVGELIFTLTLTRAPLIVTVMSLQSYLVVRFRDEPRTWWRPFLAAQGVILAGAVVLGALGWWLGPAVFAWVSGTPVSLDGSLIAVLVASSALVGALCVSAPAVLARSQHFVYSLGWVIAAVVTAVVMFTPLEFLPRVGLAVILGPVAGLLVHIGWLVTRPALPVAADRNATR